MKRTSKRKFTKILKSRLGMTYVELLTALGLLALILTAFTPMLLSSYETLYNAGEKTLDTYEAKQEIEEELARRDSLLSVKFNLNYNMNSEKLFENIEVTGKRIVSSLQENFETVFGIGRASVKIISPSHVNDDQTYHDVTLQTTSLEYSKVSIGKFNYVINQDTGVSDMPADQIHIEIIVPDKTLGGGASTGVSGSTGATTDEAVYSGSTNICKAKYFPSGSTNPIDAGSSISWSHETDNGRIKLRIHSGDADRPLDFTYSPLKVKVYYVNLRGKTRTVCDYLYIDPPSILFAGESASGADYYTSAGVKVESTDVKDSAGNIIGKSDIYTLSAEARTMRTSNSVYLTETESSHTEAKTPVGAPSSRGVSIRAIRWIDNDETDGLEPYYVMTGSEGSIYRMYNFTSDKTPIYYLATATHLSGGSTIFDAANAGNVLHHGTTGYFAGTKTTALADKVFDLATGEKCYPSMWSGDSAHTFEYSSGKKRVAYGPSANNDAGDATWLTSVEKDGKEEDPVYNVFSAKAQYCYYYFGDATGHTYPAKNSKTISYVLTERGWPLRLAGTIRQGNDDYFEEYFSLWDTFHYDSTNKYYVPDTYQVHTTADDVQGKQANYPLAFHYDASSPNTDMMNDNTTAQIKLKSLASYPLHDDLDSGENSFANYIERKIGSRADAGVTVERSDGDDYVNMWNMAKLANSSRLNHDKGQDRLVDDTGDYTGDNVEINDVIYIPSAGSTAGSTFYIGTVHAYAFIAQTDKTSQNSAMYRDTPSEIKNSDNGYGRFYLNQQGGFPLYRNWCYYPSGSVSDILVISDQDGRSTYIAMHSNSVITSDNNKGNRISEAVRGDALKGLYYNYAKDGKEVASGTTISFSYGGNNFSGTFYNGTDNQDTQTTFFLPEKDNQWSFMKLDNVYFTLGYSSSRQKVYKNVTYDGTNEYARSAERLYWRSHYGEDTAYGEETSNKQFALSVADQSEFSGNALGSHKLNSALSTTSGYLQSGTYLNSYNNDQYNVWFPGEMLNYTKVASKDGVTVAVGYNVAGSAYQYSHPTTTTNYNNGQYHITSTALGSIYNDGVLSAMIEGKDEAFVNLLYFKDNESFDGTSLTDKGLAQYTEYNNCTSDTTHSKKGYGTHSRQSIDFTAVDIVVNETATATQGQVKLDYVAYYGDSAGRLFYSTVATGTAKATDSDTENTDVDTSNIQLVSYIKDLTYAGGATGNTVGEMKEVKVKIGGTEYSLSTVFSEIITIDASDDLVIVTGPAKKTTQNPNGYECIVVGQKVFDAAGNSSFEWKILYNGTFQGVINEACIVNGYYYIVGDDFFAGVSLDALKGMPAGGTIKNTGRGYEKDDDTTEGITETSTTAFADRPENMLLWYPLDNACYAIDGR